MRFALLSISCIALVGLGLGHYHGVFLAPSRPALTSAPEAAAPPTDTLVYRADARGQVMLDAWVNGAPVRFLLDTGASKVALTAEAARAAGYAPDDLKYDAYASTAGGVVRVAPVTLREVRLEQLSLYDVPATVNARLPVSLLGMSFLGRVRGWEMRDGKLTISW